GTGAGTRQPPGTPRELAFFSRLLARDGRLRDHWTRLSGLCELPRLVDDFTGRAAELAWMSELVCAESAPGAGVAGLITGSGGMGKTTLAIRAAHVLRPRLPRRGVLP
ncbi:MAG: hypothetical protein ACRDRJ_25225, partial [Streptosporangiaceae bacterium]